jgi:CheY-like chemotaxis protein
MALRVLVVDDDALSREVFSLLLGKAKYEVETAESGDKAVGLLEEGIAVPDVILTDLQMPGITGNQLARRLRELSHPGTVLVAMSATAPEGQSASEFDGFLLKPFTMEAFDIAVKSPRTESSETAPGIAGSIVLDEGIYRNLARSMPAAKLGQLYAMCLTDAETRIGTMRVSASNGDDAAYKREAHAIKGGCGMVGALQLQTLATSMEERGLSDDHIASLDEFVLACERLRRMLIGHEISHNRASGVSGEDA